MIPEYIRKVLELFKVNDYEAYVVGGAVRDLLSGIIPHDFDIATSAYPLETKELLESNGYKTIIEQGMKHGTVVAVVDGELLEITSFRSEGEYSDLRRPDSVTFTRSIEEDVKRRDFTINSMYLGSVDEVVDLTGGREDLKNGVIRAVGNPYKRMEEDALRIMRALRFASRFGFRIEEETAKAMHELKSNLKLISVERIHTELTGIISSKYATRVLREFYDVIGVIIPKLLNTVGFDQKSNYHNLDVFEHTLKVLDGIPLDNDGKRDEALSYAALFHDIGKPEVFMFYDGRGHMKRHQEASERIVRDFCSYMKFSNKLTDDICRLVLLHDTFPEAKKVPVNKFIAENTLEVSEKLYILQRADILAHSKEGMKRLELLDAIIEIKNALIIENACFSLKDLAINGNDIKALGVTDGRRIGELLNSLFDSVISGEICNNKTDCTQFIHNLI